MPETTQGAVTSPGPLAWQCCAVPAAPARCTAVPTVALAGAAVPTVPMRGGAAPS